MIDVFQEARERVSAKQAAEHYGLEFDRTGRTRCCFHSPDRHPSMTFKGNGFRCWSCGAHGSAIDLTAELFSLTPLETVKRLNTDFSLGLELDKPPDKATVAAAQHRQEINDTYRRFEQWRDETIRRLNTCFLLAHLTMKAIEAPADLERLTNAQALAIREQSRFEWLADVLTSGSMREIMQIFRQRKEVETLCEKVLRNTPMSCGAA